MDEATDGTTTRCGFQETLGGTMHGTVDGAMQETMNQHDNVSDP